MSLRVRLRLPSKQETLTLPTPATIRSLLEGIQGFVGGELDEIGIKHGYPPKQVDLNREPWDMDVSTLGIKNGETLIVSAESTVAEKPAAAPPERTFTPSQGSFTRSIPPASPRVRPSEPPEIPVEGGSVVLRIMADDNSCMYILLYLLIQV